MCQQMFHNPSQDLHDFSTFSNFFLLLSDINAHTVTITTPRIPVTLWMNWSQEIPLWCLTWTDSTSLSFFDVFD